MTRVIFLHIPRTGGVTLRRALRRQFPGAPMHIPLTEETSTRRAAQIATALAADPDADIVQVTRNRPTGGTTGTGYNTHLLAGLQATWPDRWAEMPLIQDHAAFGLHEHLPGPSTYITLIRDPIDRAVSMYFHHRREGRLRRTLDDYLRSDDYALDNGQTRLLAATGLSMDYGEMTEDHLRTAKRRLVDHFGWVGVTERYDEGMVLLRRTFGWRPLYYAALNGTARTRGAFAPDPDVLAALRRRNELDTELHRFATELFEERAAADPGLVHELARYRWLNRLYGPAARTRIAAGQAVRRAGRIALGRTRRR